MVEQEYNFPTVVNQVSICSIETVEVRGEYASGMATYEKFRVRSKSTHQVSRMLYPPKPD